MFDTLEEVTASVCLCVSPTQRLALTYLTSGRFSRKKHADFAFGTRVSEGTEGETRHNWKS